MSGASVEPALRIRGLSFTYPRAAQSTLESVSLSVQPGEVLAIVGPNGAGKTTLLRIVQGLQEGYRGEVRVLGLSPGEARRRGLVGSVAQRSGAMLAYPVSGHDVVMMGATVGLPGWRSPAAGVRERVIDALERVDALRYADAPIGTLSGGQLQRIMVARALVIEPKLLILDEPTVGIDAAGQERFADLLARLKEHGNLTILLVMHDLRAVASGAASCDRIACLRRSLHFHDTPSGITAQVLADVFEHDLSPIFRGLHIEASGEQPRPPRTDQGSHDAGHDHADGGSCAHH
ncbi:MAG: metal ABC transporter ATP-binding protein [Phycisphaeraceae bacterium]|nr:MAG: metal ABC transporter ATP-binding protein [Phycisphaeraceae bacterium]